MYGLTTHPCLAGRQAALPQMEKGVREKVPHLGDLGGNNKFAILIFQLM
jgi:hypothetical protein